VTPATPLSVWLHSSTASRGDVRPSRQRASSSSRFTRVTISFLPEALHDQTLASSRACDLRPMAA